MYYADELRSPEELTAPGEDIQITERELQMAKSLVDMLTTADFDLMQYKDNYREALLELIRQKSEGQVVTTAPVAEPTKVTDLMEALRASVEAAQKRKDSAVVEEAEVSRRRARRASA